MTARTPGPLLVLLFLTVATAALGTEPDVAAPPALELTLTAAVERALAASPRLESLAARRDAAGADVRAAEAERRPVVDVAAGYMRHSNVPEVDVPLPGGGVRTLFPNLPNNWTSQVSLELPFYTGGRTRGLFDAADRGRAAARFDMATGRADVVLETRAAYWRLVTARETERVLREGLASYESHLNDARNRRELGLAATNEVLAVQVERDRAELGRLRAAGEVAIAAADLARLLDLPSGTAVEPLEPLDGPAEIALDREALVERALRTRPARAALRSRVEAAEAGVRVERSGLRPQAAVSAEYDFARPNREILPPEDRWDDTWHVGVAVSFHVYDGGRIAARVERAAAEARALHHELVDLDRQIRLQVLARSQDVETAAASIAVARSNLEAAAENRRVAADRYREGVSPSSELLDAETLLLRAGLDVADALARLQVARAALDRAVGDGAGPA